MVNAKFPELFTSPVFFFFLVCKCGIYHLYHIITPQYLHIRNIFARSTFVQKLLFRPVPVTIINLSA